MEINLGTSLMMDKITALVNNFVIIHHLANTLVLILQIFLVVDFLATLQVMGLHSLNSSTLGKHLRNLQEPYK